MWVNEYVGLPFLDRGRSKAGLDCWGLVAMAFKEQLSVVLPGFDTIGAYDAKAVLSAIVRTCKLDEWTSHKKPKDFDVVIMKSIKRHDDGKVRKLETHVGLVCCDGTRILHIEQGINAMCVPISSPQIKNRITRFMRHELATAK